MKIEIQSFGAGVQSVALAILNATGRVTPRADLAVFCDPGSEEVETYRLLPIYAEWLGQYDYPLATVKAREGDLAEYLGTRSIPIPIYRANEHGDAMGHRQCTNKWKIQPLYRAARALGADHLVCQLGISLDEYHRMKPAKVQWVENRWPLIELRLSRRDCLTIISEADLPIPPKSACTFCPYQSTSRWQWRAIERPEEFEQVAQLEDVIRAREPNVYLSRHLRPLRTVVSGAQMTLDDALDGEECTGVCFT